MKTLSKAQFFNIIKCFIVIMCLTMIINTGIKSFHYSLAYDNMAGVIKYKDMYTSFMHTSFKDETMIKDSFAFLSGNIDIGKINIHKNTIINIKTNTKTGKVKIILLNDKNEIIMYKELTQEAQIELLAGEYRVMLLGKYFTGAVTLDML